MKLFESLHSELNDHPAGEYAPYYYCGMGYRANLKEKIAMMRARGIESLFTLPAPRIHPSDRIAGSTDGLYADVCPEILRDTRQLVDQIGRRSFPTNFDHYSPNYDHVMAVGVPGLMAEIDASLRIGRRGDRTGQKISPVGEPKRPVRILIDEPLQSGGDILNPVGLHMIRDDNRAGEALRPCTCGRAHQRKNQESLHYGIVSFIPSARYLERA